MRLIYQKYHQMQLELIFITMEIILRAELLILMLLLHMTKSKLHI